MKPETPLPWEYLPEIPDSDRHAHGTWHDADYNYVIHACNAYPKLVEFVKGAIWGSTEGGVTILKDLGEL